MYHRLSICLRQSWRWASTKNMICFPLPLDLIYLILRKKVIFYAPKHLGEYLVLLGYILAKIFVTHNLRNISKSQCSYKNALGRLGVRIKG